jgi:hypothetical protein
MLCYPILNYISHFFSFSFFFQFKARFLNAMFFGEFLGKATCTMEA